jgi:hypothetical protein
MGWVVSVTPRPRFTPFGTHWIRGWVGPRAAGARRKILCSCRGLNPDRPARSQTLYWLSYRGSETCFNVTVNYKDLFNILLHFQSKLYEQFSRRWKCGLLSFGSWRHVILQVATTFRLCLNFCHDDVRDMLLRKADDHLQDFTAS